jgi:hypothetical protein
MSGVARSGLEWNSEWNGFERGLEKAVRLIEE